MKKILCFIGCSVLCFLLTINQIFVVAKEQNTDKINYVVNSDNTITISSYNTNNTEITIPATIDGFHVKSIGYHAVQSTDVEIIHISEGIEIIENDAIFVNFNLKELYIPSTVKSMGSILGCYKLEKIIVDENNPYFIIGEDGWLYNKDKTEVYWCPPSVKGTVVVGNGVKVIKKDAFAHCRELTTVVIRKSVEKIEKEAFGWQDGDGIDVIFYNPNTEIIPAFSEYNTHAPGFNNSQIGSFGEVKTVYGYLGSTAEAVFTKKSNNPSDPEDYRPYRIYPEIEFRPIIDIKINGKTMEFDTAPYIKNDRTMVPMRAIFEALGATVSWDNETRSVIGLKDSTQIKITIGENVLYKNGEAIDLDTPAEIKNDRTMVPARAISEAFGADVLWDNDNRAVKITLDKALKVIHIGTHAAYEDDPYSENCIMTEEEKAAAIKALDKVEEALGVRIEFVQYTTSDYRQLIAESIAEGNPFCDLAVLWAGSEKSALDADILQSMDAYADVFEGNYPIKSKADGHYYFMSRNFSFVNTWPIVYNIQLLDKIPALKEADGTTLYPAEMYYRGEWTFSAFEEYLEKIKAHCDSYTGINAYYAPVPFETNYIYFTCEALHAAGAGIYDGESILAASDSAISACEYVTNLFDKGLVSCSSAEKHPNDAGWISATDAFLQGKTYFTNCAKWKMNNANNPVGVVPFPKIDGESAGYEHVNFGTDSVGLVKGVDEKTSRLALMAYKMYTEEYCKALADVASMDEFASSYAATDAKSFGVDVTHPEIGQYHADIWAEYAKTPVNEYSEAFGLLYKWGDVFGKCTFGDIGFDNYKEMTESIK